MRGYKQLAPLVADDDAIDIDQLVRDAASGVQADARARRTDTPDLSGGNDDLPYIPLDLDESEYTFQAPRIEPRRPVIPSGPMSSAFANAARGAFDSARSTLAPLFTPRAQTPASPSAPLASPPPAAQTAPGTTPQPPETQVAPQAQQAPAVAPPGQGGQPPAQDAAEEAPLSSVPTEGGNMRPEAAPMLTPMADRARKFAEAPGAFKPTGDEEARLADAQRLDDQGARRQRIARGILSGVGLLGAATGLNGLAGIGAAGLGATNAASRAPNERTNRVREEIARRMQGMQAEREAANQAATREAQGIESQRQAARQAMLDERSGRMDEAQIANLNARTESEQAERAQSAMEAEIERGNIEGARGIFRSFVGSLNDNARGAIMARQFIASPAFASATAEDLRHYQTDLVGLAKTRHTQLLTRGGGGGSRQNTDPDTLAVTRSRARRGVPSATLPPTYEEIQAARAEEAAAAGTPEAGDAEAPAQAPPPVRRPAGTPRPQPAAAPTPTPSPDGVAPTIAPDARAQSVARLFPDLSASERNVLVAEVIRRRFTPEQMQTDGRVQANLLATLERYRGAARGERTAIEGDAIATMAQDINPDQLEIDEPRYARAAVRADNMINQARDFGNAAEALREAIEWAGNDPARLLRLNSAIHGGPTEAAFAGVVDLNSMIQMGNERFGRNQSGAAISASEWATFRHALSEGSRMNSPAAVMRAFRRLYQAARDNARRVMRHEGGPNAEAEYRRRDRVARGGGR